jgi:hypothetical protein
MINKSPTKEKKIVDCKKPIMNETKTEKKNNNSEEDKLLHVILNSKLNWKDHIDVFSRRLNSTIYQIRSLMR